MLYMGLGLSIFDFRSFLNIGMLLTTSEKAKQVRSLMLDIVIAIINEKTGGQLMPIATVRSTHREGLIVNALLPQYSFFLHSHFKMYGIIRLIEH